MAPPPPNAVSAALASGRRRIARLRVNFKNSQTYWDRRYRQGQTSGAGSYGRLAEYKASYLNDLVETEGIVSVVDLGCGDGNQLSLADYPEYHGLDVSPEAIRICTERFANDKTKRFTLIDPTTDAASIGRSDLAISLDVIYHLVENDVFEAHMGLLFSVADRFVAIYASEGDTKSPAAAHVLHRHFPEWIQQNRPDWSLIRQPAQPFPYDSSDPDNTSFASFHIYERRDG